MTGLVMVCAGIMLANIVFPRQQSDRAIAAPGLLINIFFGTFVEAAYPFMFSDKKVMFGAIVSGGVGGIFVGLYNLRGTAYVPSVLAPIMSTNTFGFILSMVAACGSAFIITSLANKIALKNNI